MGSNINGFGFRVYTWNVSVLKLHGENNITSFNNYVNKGF